MLVHHEVWEYYNRVLDKYGPDALILAPYFAMGSGYIGYFGPASLSSKIGRGIKGGSAGAFVRTMRDMRAHEMALVNVYQRGWELMGYTKKSEQLGLTRKAWQTASIRSAQYAEGAAGISARRAFARRAVGKGLIRMAPFLGWAMLSYDIYTIVRHGTFWGIDVPGVPEGGWI